MLTNPCRKRRLGNSHIRFQRRRTLWTCKPSSMHWSIVCKFSTLIGQLLSDHHACHSSSFIRWRSTSHETSLSSSQRAFFISVQRSQKSDCSNQTNVRNQNKTPEESSHDKWFWFSLVINNSILITGNVFCFPMVYVSDKQDPSLKGRQKARAHRPGHPNDKKSNVLLPITLLFLNFYGHKWIN